MTARVVDELVHRGHRTISLFVGETNTGARGIYERLGFGVLRPLVAFRWDHLAQG
ncbi:Mycothiol acetyltransferase [compost metagenome]